MILTTGQQFRAYLAALPIADLRDQHATTADRVDGIQANVDASERRGEMGMVDHYSGFLAGELEILEMVEAELARRAR